MELELDSIYFNEPSAIRSSVDYHRKEISKGQLKPIEVINIDGQWLVTNGTNRSMASWIEGNKTIEVKEPYMTEDRVRIYRHTLQKRMRDGGPGIEHLPIDFTEDERAKRY